MVTRENRPSLNYYVLLAGSAVVIKEDERGNTNPTWFMQRGDVFGVRLKKQFSDFSFSFRDYLIIICPLRNLFVFQEREIFEGQCWGWSVVTLDTCEFLMIDKKDYRRIFLSEGRGFTNDPDRAMFLK